MAFLVVIGVFVVVFGAFLLGCLATVVLYRLGGAGPMEGSEDGTMVGDIVVVLRNEAARVKNQPDARRMMDGTTLHEEAADEIERLRAEVARLKVQPK